MSRKKTKIISSEATNMEITEIQHINQAISYQGNVTASLKLGDTVLSKQVIKNKGCYAMFKFIANVLAGNYIRTSRPCKIRLFTATTNNKLADFDPSLAVSPYILCNTAAVGTEVKSSTTGEYPDTASITYTFLIPFSVITDKVCRAALYGMDPSDTILDRCAEITFTTPYEKVTGAAGANTILEIKWEILITNKTITTTD